MAGPTIDENQSDVPPVTQLSSQIIHHHYTQPDNSVFPKTLSLDESNYTIWAPLMRMRIGARVKIGYLTGAKVEPPINSPEYEN